MSPVDALAPDQRAVLQLLLKQGKGYDELAGLLRIEPGAVRDRAATALETLGPRDGQVPTPERRAEIGDFLLGQQSASARASTRAYLEGSATGRAWARVVAGELRPLGGDALPEIPAEGAEVDEAFESHRARTARREEVQRSSKLGGALLLAGIGIVLAVVLVWALSNGKDDTSGKASTSTSTTSTASTPTSSTTSTAAGQPQVLAQVNLNPPSGSPAPKAIGVLNVLAQGGQKALALQAQGLPATTRKSFYALWLAAGAKGKSRRIGFTPAVGKDGKTSGVQQLPSDAASYSQVLVTRETSTNPGKPGATVLSGRLQIPRGGG